MKVLTILSGLVLCFCVSTLCAQRSIYLLTLSGQYSPKASYQNKNGTASEQAYLINLKVPILFNKGKTVWYSDVTYNHFNVNSNLNHTSTLANNINIHGIIMQTGIAQKFGDKNALQLLFAPRFMGDFKAPDKRNFQPGFVALFEHEFKPRMLMRFGAMYNADLFGPMLVPLVYIDWSINNSNWFIKGLVPIYSKIGFQINKKLSTGLGHFGLVTSYALTTPELKNSYLERKSIDVFSFLRYHLWNNLHLEARLGYALSRDYAQYTNGDEIDFKLTVLSFGDNRNRLNTRFNDQFIVNLRLVYNYPLAD